MNSSSASINTQQCLQISHHRLHKQQQRIHKQQQCIHKQQQRIHKQAQCIHDSSSAPHALEGGEGGEDAPPDPPAPSPTQCRASSLDSSISQFSPLFVG
eukprot:1549468-Rhodomonas_salina.2